MRDVGRMPVRYTSKTTRRAGGTRRRATCTEMRYVSRVRKIWWTAYAGGLELEAVLHPEYLLWPRRPGSRSERSPSSPVGNRQSEKEKSVAERSLICRKRRKDSQRERVRGKGWKESGDEVAKLGVRVHRCSLPRNTGADSIA